MEGYVLPFLGLEEENKVKIISELLTRDQTF